MASIFVVSVDAIALAAATAKSVFELAAPSGQQVKIKQWWVEFDGVTPTAVPVKVEACVFSAAITTGTTITPAPLDGSIGVANSVCKHTSTSEGAGTPTTGGPIHRIPPTSGYGEQSVLGVEPTIIKGGFWRIRLTAAAIVNATFGVVFEE